MVLDDFPALSDSAGATSATARRAPALVMIDCRYGRHALTDANAPQLCVTDLAVTRGDGVFESMLARDGLPRKPQAHLRRLAASAAAAELAAPDERVWMEAIATALRALGPCREAQLRLVLSRGPEGGDAGTAWVYASDCSSAHDAARSQGIDALLLERGYDSALNARAPWLLMGAKTLSYAVNMAALRHAQRHGADDVVFVSSDGRILEGPTSTVVVAQRVGERIALLTPPPECGILAGTTQSALFQAAAGQGWQAEYAALTPDDLNRADGVWLVSSIRLLAPLNRLDGHTLARSAELDRRLLAMLFDAG